MRAVSRKQENPMRSANPHPADLMTAQTVAAYLDISTRTIWKMTKAGTLPAPVYISARSPRWRKSEIESRLAALSQEKLARLGSNLGSSLPYVALNAVDTHIRQRHGHQVVIDGMAIGPGDSRLVTGWHTAKCGDMPQTASLPLAGRDGVGNSRWTRRG